MTSHVSKCAFKLMSLPLKPPSILGHRVEVWGGALPPHSGAGEGFGRAHSTNELSKTHLLKSCIYTCASWSSLSRSRETQAGETDDPDSFITWPQTQWWKSAVRNVRKILTSIRHVEPMSLPQCSVPLLDNRGRQNLLCRSARPSHWNGSMGTWVASVQTTTSWIENSKFH